MTIELRDVEDRLQHAYVALRRLMLGATNQWERTRLQGKMEGVALALSYLREPPRPAVDPFDDADRDGEIEQAIRDFIDRPLGPQP